MSKSPFIKNVTFHAEFPPIRNRVLRHLRPFLRAIGLHRPGNVTLSLNEMNIDTTYKYLYRLAEGYQLLVQDLKEGSSILDGIKTGFQIGKKIAQILPGAYAIITGINDIEFFQTLTPSQNHILEEALEEANPILVEEKRRMEYLYLLHTGLLEQAKQAEQIVTQQAQKEEVA